MTARGAGVQFRASLPQHFQPMRESRIAIAIAFNHGVPSCLKTLPSTLAADGRVYSRRNGGTIIHLFKYPEWKTDEVNFRFTFE